LGRKCFVYFQNQTLYSEEATEQIRIIVSLNNNIDNLIPMLEEISQDDTPYPGAFLYLHDNDTNPFNITQTNNAFTLIQPGTYHFLNIEKTIYKRKSGTKSVYFTTVQSSPLKWNLPNVTIIDLTFTTLKVDVYTVINLYGLPNLVTDIGGALQYISFSMLLGGIIFMTIEICIKNCGCKKFPQIWTKANAELMVPVHKSLKEIADSLENEELQRLMSESVTEIT